MNLIKSEIKKSVRESIVYYPDFIVSSMISLMLFYFLVTNNDNYTLLLVSYLIWIITSGVLSEASAAISTEKQIGTLQNLLIKPYSILTILIAKTISWFIINLIKTIFFLFILNMFYDVSSIFRVEFLLIIIISAIGIMGLSLVLSALTLVFTKVASFEIIISYLLLFLSGSIVDVPRYVIYTNPLSLATYLASRVLSGDFSWNDLFTFISISMAYFAFGVIVFKIIFSRSKDFKWTY